MIGAGENFIVSKDNMAQLKEELQKAVREVPNFDKLKNHIDMTVTLDPANRRISLIVQYMIKPEAAPDSGAGAPKAAPEAKAADAKTTDAKASGAKTP